MPQSFSAVVREGVEPTHVVVAGEVDMYSAPRLQQVLSDVIGDTSESLRVDIRDVEFIDSTGLGVLVAAHKRVQESGGELIVEGARPSIRKVFEITGIDRILPVRD